jgi:hypothetical protein
MKMKNASEPVSQQAVGLEGTGTVKDGTHYTQDEKGQTIAVNDGGSMNPGGVRVAILKPGEFGPNDRVALVRWPSGKTATFGGDLLKTALQNGATIVKELQAFNPNKL